jgi:signal transduction histidine kinase
MNEFLINAFVFVGSALSFIFLMFLWAWYQLPCKSFKCFKEYFLSVETGGGKGALEGIAASVIITTIIAGLVTLVYSSTSNAQVRILDSTTIFAGLESTFKTSPMCYSDGVDDKLTSNLGVRQHVVGYKDINLNLQYTHHSCAINRDSKAYDAVGVQIEWLIKR